MPFRLITLLRKALWLTIPLLSTALFAQNDLRNSASERRIDGLLRQMTLEEKIGQLVQYSAGSPTGPGTGRTDYREQIAKGVIGSLLNLTGAVETNVMQRIAVEKSRLKIPLLFGLDVIHGYHTVFPVPLGMASTWDPDLVQQAARVAAEEATTEGIRWTFSPMVDIARDARWGRIVEGAGEDPYLGSIMSAAYVRGYQGISLANPDSLAACAKHFVGYGAAEAGRDYNPADMSERTLRNIYLPPFYSAVHAGAVTVMSSFNSLNGVPATADAMTLTKILRDEWRFQGLVVSDWDAVGELIAQGVATDGATAAKKALLAGLDMDMESGTYQKNLAILVQSGGVPVSVLDESVRRVLRIKFALGLFDHPYTPEEGTVPGKASDRIALARTVAERSLVLLKNDPVAGQPVLPIASSVHTIALIGPMADSAVNMLGSWPGKGDPATAVTLKAALQERLQPLSTSSRPSTLSTSLLYARGTDVSEAIQTARQSDLVILALGEDAASMTGEAASRATLGLPGNQEQLLEAVAATGKPVVLVLFNGRPLALPWAARHVPAIVEAWYPGVQAGPALVQALFGDVDFSGRLTVSFPRSVGQEPLYYNPLRVGRPAEGTDLSRPPTTDTEKYVSRYIDEQNSPQFPFGYGLSYTRFTYSPVQVSTSTTSAEALNRGSGAVHVSSTITNSGARLGQEVVQLYVGERGASVVRPVRELKGFKLVALAPGESKRVEFNVGREELAFWNLEMRYEVEPARVDVWIATNSAEGKPAEFTISK
jgi:beta-glucosidase